MKRIIFIAAAFAAGSHARAQWAVIDAANLSQSISNYAALVQQIAKQGQEITNQVQQIQLMTDELNRLGKMSDYLGVVGSPQLEIDIGTPSQMQTWDANLASVNGTGLFGDTRGGIYTPVASTYTDFNGDSVARDPSLYKPNQELTASVDNFKSVQSDVYTRRTALRQAISQTSAALEAATTDAQEKKLADTLNAEYGELASIDSEVMLGAMEVQVKASEAVAMNAAQEQSGTESRTQLAQQESDKLTTTFQPTYSCILQYVNEEPYQQ